MSSRPAISGYSCQSALSLLVATAFAGGSMRWWMAGDFFPVQNANSSQPVQIYQWLHLAHSSGSATAKTFRLRAALLDWMEQLHEEKKLSDAQRKQAYRLIVETTDGIAMRPAVYFLSGVVEYDKGDEPDEYRSGLLPINCKAIHAVLPHRLDSKRVDDVATVGSDYPDIVG